MRSRLAHLVSVSAVGVFTFGASVASAQDAPADPTPAPVEAPAAAPADAPAAAPAPASSGDKDGVRFRGGVSGGVGAEIVGGGLGTAIMGGVDGRMGVQINDMIGVYAQPHLSFGSFGGVTGMTGTFAGSAIVDFTFIDQLFVGAGGGFGVLNNPTGPLLHVRAGGYPLVGEGEDGIRRKGLMLAFDMRVFFLDGLTAVYPMGSIGYEAF